MLNPFPELFDFSLYAPFVLRTALGLTLFFFSFSQLVEYKAEAQLRFVSAWPKYGVPFLWTLGVFEVIAGLLLFAGLFVQYTALLLALISFCAIFSRKFHRATKRHMTFYVLTFAISVSLLLTGAGLFALDMPL